MKQLFTYLLAMLALLTVSQKMVAEDYYLRGAYGDGAWDATGTKMTNNGDGTYTLVYTSTETGEFRFRFKSSDYKAELCPFDNTYDLTQAKPSYGVAYTDNAGKGDYYFTVQMTKSYTYTFKVDVSNSSNRQASCTEKSSSSESYKSFYLIGGLTGTWNKDETRQFTTTDGETYTYTFPADVTGDYYFRVMGKNADGTYFDEHLKPASVKNQDTSTPITTDFTAVDYGDYASWKLSLEANKSYTVTLLYYSTKSPQIKYEAVSTVVTNYGITVTGGGAMTQPNTTGVFSCDLTSATEDGAISAFTIDGVTYGLSEAETAGTSSATKYTFVKGKSSALTLPKGYKYTLTMSPEGILTVTPSSGSTGRKLSEGFYLVGNFFNTDKNIINYDNAVFKFREQQKDDNSNADDNTVTYMVEIPATVTAHAQIMQANFAGSIVGLYGPGEIKSVSCSSPAADQSLTGTLKFSAKENGEDNNYWNMTTRNVSADNYTDGTYEISFVYNTQTKEMGAWTLHHNAHKRVAYYLRDSNDAVAQPIYDSNNKGDIGTGFSNKFFASINMEEGASYYVVSNYVVREEESYIKGIPQNQYGALLSNKTILPTLNKLFLTGNGGYDFGSKPYNEVSPNEGPFRVGANSGIDGTLIVEYNPSNGDDATAKKTNHYGVRGQIILRDANLRIKSVSMVGTAIPGTTITDDDWDYTSTVGDMTYDNSETCYTLTLITSANELNKRFRFVANRNSERTWYENGTDQSVKAKIPYNGTGSGHAATVSDPNIVSYAAGGENHVTDTGEDVNIIWNRPAGKWTVKFYFQTVSGGNDPKTTYYYTITENSNLEMRDYGDVHYKGNKRIVEGIGDYKYFVTWSDTKAWEKPDNVDAFYVSAITPATETEGAKITLTQLEKTYLPANTGLVLAAKEKSQYGRTVAYNESGNNSTFNLLEEPMTEYSGTTDEVTSLLSTQVSPATVPTESNDGWNYLFGFYKKMNVYQSETDASKFLLGFWLSKGQNLSYPHCAYLHLTKEQASDKYYVGNTYNMSEAISPSGAKLMPAVLLDFKSGVVTGITDVNAKENVNADGKYYTLSGVAVSKPTTNGVYIHNGKKYIVK